MPVRFRITFLFILFTFIVLGIVCGSVYYFSFIGRVNSIKKRLTNRAITMGRLLGKKESFDQRLIRQFDSLTAVALKEKLVQVYDYENKLIYRYSDVAGDSLAVDEETLNDARVKQRIYFRRDNKDAIVYHYTDQNHRIVIISAANDEDGKTNLLRLRNILVTSFLLGIITALLVGYLFSRKLLTPLKKISSDVSEISVQNLTRRVSTGRVKDEWYFLANTFNELLNKLQEGFEIQRRFISNASHELSTPLTSITSQLEVILENDRSPAEYKRVIQSVCHDVHHISKLTQTLLEFAGASGNKGGLEINLVRIDEILMDLPAELVKLNKDYEVILNFQGAPSDEERLFVFGNEPLLMAALKNIASNACKYSKDKRAFVNLKTEARDIIIEIKDQGIGIPESEIQNIFEPFYRVEENKQVGSGFGLGLSIAYRIIKLHEGQIFVNSKKNEGTLFTIILPSVDNLGNSKF